MTKVVYNGCFGGFSFSEKACERLLELEVEGADKHGSRDVCRHDPLVIQVVEEMGSVANGRCAKLCIAEVSGNLYRIDEYDGSESVQEPSDIPWINIEPIH
jgi:hypothetical protein